MHFSKETKKKFDPMFSTSCEKESFCTFEIFCYKKTDNRLILINDTQASNVNQWHSGQGLRCGIC